MLNDLKRVVCKANKELIRMGVVKFAWGNVSAFDPSMGLLVVKPHGVPYDELQPELMVVVSMDGQKVEGRLEPTIDVMTHVGIYSAWPMTIGAVARTHSCMATSYAQAGLPLTVLGTSHADMFCGDIPITRRMTDEECEQSVYRENVAKVLVEAVSDPVKVQAALVNQSGPFAWGKDCFEAVKNIALVEDIATMAYYTQILNPNAEKISDSLLNVRYNIRNGLNG